MGSRPGCVHTVPHGRWELTAAIDGQEVPERRRLDRILSPGFADGVSEMTMDEVRRRRDDCLAEREYLSYLRRLIHGRMEIIGAELKSRDPRAAGEQRPLVERLHEVLGGDTPMGPSRGEYVRVGLPEDEIALARRRMERLVNDVAIGDPASLSDEQLKQALDALLGEEKEVSAVRRRVLDLHDVFQEEVKHRYKQQLAGP